MLFIFLVKEGNSGTTLTIEAPASNTKTLLGSQLSDVIQLQLIFKHNMTELYMHIYKHHIHVLHTYIHTFPWILFL